MADGARVGDLDAIRAFRATLIKFIEASNAALTDGESEITRTMSRLDGEQTAFWTAQIRKLGDLIGQLKEQIRMKKLFKDSSGRTPSAFDEEKKLRFAQQKMAVAEEKLANTRRWAKQLQREHLLLRGGLQRLQTMLSSELPNGVATLETIIVRLDAYLSAGTPTLATSDAGMTQPAGPSPDGGAMRRAVDEGVERTVDRAEDAVPTTAEPADPEGQS